MLVPADRWLKMRLPKHSVHVLAFAVVAVVLGGWPRWRSSQAFPASAVTGSVRVTTVARTTRTLANQRIEFPYQRNQFTAVLVEIGAGSQTGPYRHVVPSFVHVLEGIVTFEVEGQGARIFSAGQGVAAGINLWHNARNLTEMPVKILIIYVGTHGQRVNLWPEDDAFNLLPNPFEP